MNLTKLYDDMISREPISYMDIKRDRRIAALKPNEELDILKVDDVGYVNIFRYDKKLVAVAKVCPGQASIILNKKGEIYLNNLVETWGTTPTTRYLDKNPWMVDYPGLTLEDINKERGVLSRYKKAHWIYVMDQPIVSITKQEMRIIQEAIPV